MRKIICCQRRMIEDSTKLAYGPRACSQTSMWNILHRECFIYLFCLFSNRINPSPHSAKGYFILNLCVLDFRFGCENMIWILNTKSYVREFLAFANKRIVRLQLMIFFFIVKFYNRTTTTFYKKEVHKWTIRMQILSAWYLFVSCFQYNSRLL